MSLIDAPEWVDRVLVDLAIALSAGAAVGWILLVLPDPEPLVTLPTLLGVQPAVWLTFALFVVCYPLVRWSRREVM